MRWTIWNPFAKYSTSGVPPLNWHQPNLTTAGSRFFKRCHASSKPASHSLCGIGSGATSSSTINVQFSARSAANWRAFLCDAAIALVPSDNAPGYFSKPHALWSSSRVAVLSLIACISTRSTPRGVKDLCTNAARSGDVAIDITIAWPPGGTFPTASCMNSWKILLLLASSSAIKAATPLGLVLLPSFSSNSASSAVCSFLTN
mmetsp:Transcript_91522/g.144614  ORF Transcript_91522/g.144614 Transcript_91522/m.144614 type:complete len:203 (-) Transcript_91522:143-751(-)